MCLKIQARVHLPPLIYIGYRYSYILHFSKMHTLVHSSIGIAYTYHHTRQDEGDESAM